MSTGVIQVSAADVLQFPASNQLWAAGLQLTTGDAHQNSTSVLQS